jgi:hypothetical protein
MAAGFYFTSYSEWRNALTIRCGIALTPDYALARIEALENPGDASTREFTRCYGEPYRCQVVEWFRRAASEAR